MVRNGKPFQFLLPNIDEFVCFLRYSCLNTYLLKSNLRKQYYSPQAITAFSLIKSGFFSTSARQRACYSISCNRTFPSWILPLINDESLCKPFHTKMSLLSIKVNWQLINFHFEWFRSEDSFRHRDLQAARKCPSKWNVQKDSHKQKAAAPDNLLTKVLTHSNLFTP